MYTNTARGPLGWPETPAWRPSTGCGVPGLDSRLSSAIYGLRDAGQVAAVQAAGVSAPSCKTARATVNVEPQAHPFPLPKHPAATNCEPTPGHGHCPLWPEQNAHPDDHLEAASICLIQAVDEGGLAWAGISDCCDSVRAGT